MASKRKEKARALKKARKEARMRDGEGRQQSKYAKKNRAKEIARGYSTRKTSPFYLSPEQVRAMRSEVRKEGQAA